MWKYFLSIKENWNNDLIYITLVFWELYFQRYFKIQTKPPWSSSPTPLSHDSFFCVCTVIKLWATSLGKESLLRNTSPYPEETPVKRRSLYHTFFSLSAPWWFAVAPERRTFEFIVLRVRWEEGVGEELGEGEPSILGPILHIVSYCGLQFLHEFWTWGSQLLNYFVPLVNVWEVNG